MAVLSTNRIRWRYTDDDGNNYVVTAEKALTDQANQGGVAADGTEKALPPRWRMRKRYVQSGTTTRAVTVYATDAPFWTGTNNTIQLMLNSVATTFTQTDRKLREADHSRVHTHQDV